MCFSCASFHIVSRPSVQLSFPTGWVQMKPGSCTWWFFIFDCTAQRFFSDSDKKLLNQSISSLHCNAYMFSMDQNTSWIFSLMKTEFWIKSVPCDSALPGGTGCGAISSLWHWFSEDFLWCSSSVPWEQRSSVLCPFLGKAAECLLQAFMENKALRVKAEGRAWSQMYSYWRNHFGNCVLRFCGLGHFINKGIQAQLMYFCFHLIHASSGLKIHFIQSWSGLGGKGP